MPANAATSIAPELLANPPAPAETDEPDAQTAPEPEEPEALVEDAEDSEETQQEEVSPEAQLSEWVGLLEDNPASITRIPRAKQGDVLSAMQERWTAITQNAMQHAYQAGIEASTQQTTVSRQVEALDALLEEGDTAAFRDALAEFPGGESAYYEAKAKATPKSVSPVERYQERANAIFADLNARPDVQERLKAQWNYSGDEAGIARLEADVRRFLMESPGGKQTDTDLEQRRAAAERRAKAPKAEASQGAGAGVGSLDYASFIKLPESKQSELISKMSKDDFDRFMSTRK